MPRYGSFGKFDTEVMAMRKNKKRVLHKTEKPRIPSISVGVAYDINNQPISVNTFGSVLPDVTSEVDLNTSETDVEDKKHYEPNILEKALERTICYHMRRRIKTSGWAISVLCLLTVIFNAAILVTAPIYTASLSSAGGDGMIVLLTIAAVIPLPVVVLSLFMKHAYDKTITLKPTTSLVMYALMGFCLSLRLNIGIFASHPHKTPQDLQPGLSGAVVPFSVVVTLALLRKGFSKRRVVCSVIGVIGVFFAVEPSIWPLDGGKKGPLFYSDDLVKKIVWPSLYCLSFLPLTVYHVLAEKELKKRGMHAFSLATSGMLSACVFTVLMFGTDFLPWYGNVSSFTQFWGHLKRGFKCSFSYASECQHCLVKMIVLASSIGLLNMVSILLVSATEDSVFTSLVTCLSVPVARGLWTIFDYDYDMDTIVWRPFWSKTTAFLLASIAVLVPTVIAYSIFSVKDAKDAKRDKNGYSDISSSEYEWE